VVVRHALDQAAAATASSTMQRRSLKKKESTGTAASATTGRIRLGPGPPDVAGLDERALHSPGMRPGRHSQCQKTVPAVSRSFYTEPEWLSVGGGAGVL
jgi:hypothetical protein